MHIDSTPKVIYFIFGIKRENILMGLKIDFKFEIFDLKKGEIFLQNEKNGKSFYKKNWIWKNGKSFNKIKKIGNPFINHQVWKKREIFLQNEKKEIF